VEGSRGRREAAVLLVLLLVVVVMMVLVACFFLPSIILIPADNPMISRDGGSEGGGIIRVEPVR